MKNKDRKEINIKITLGWVISVRRHDLGYTQHKMARAVGISDLTVSRIESDDGITPDNNTLRKIAEYLKIDYNSLLTLKPVLVRRLVLFVNGMSNDFFLLSTDAPQKYIEEYCKWYNKWMEDGGQGDPLEPLRKKYYVNLLIDSETSDREELEAIIDGKTVESYDLFRYWDDK